MSGAMGSHHSARPISTDWFTPPFIIEALGGPESFDLDAATAWNAPFPTARACYTKEDDGLLRPWWGRVWLNPPYTNDTLHAFMRRPRADRKTLTLKGPRAYGRALTGLVETHAAIRRCRFGAQRPIPRRRSSGRHV